RPRFFDGRIFHSWPPVEDADHLLCCPAYAAARSSFLDPFTRATSVAVSTRLLLGEVHRLSLQHRRSALVATGEFLAAVAAARLAVSSSLLSLFSLTLRLAPCFPPRPSSCYPSCECVVGSHLS